MLHTRLFFHTHQLNWICYSSSAPSDYTDNSFPLIFSPDDVTSRILCGNISITADNMAEDTEVFSVFLNSSDPAVNLTQMNVPVEILDNNSK